MGNVEEEELRSVVNFSLREWSDKFAPRLGCLSVQKSESHEIALDTPAMLVSTSRGTIPHLTRDQIKLTKASKMLLLPFESFLERMPPAPCTLSGSRRLEKFVNMEADNHIVAMCLRDPLDDRELPSNGDKFVSAICVRGVRKVTPDQYQSYVEACNPDIVFALTDVPFTTPPFSQRRVAKSLERSQAWLSSMVKHSMKKWTPGRKNVNTFVQMVGDINEAARESFAYLLTEAVEGREAEIIAPFKCLDDGVLGYSFGISPLRTSLFPPSTPHRSHQLTDPSPAFGALLRASLSPLSASKPRLVTGTVSPHEILLLIRDVGIDIFDVAWAHNAANWGIALDFCFPAPDTATTVLDLGHNLYNKRYETDFSSFSDTFLDRCSASGMNDVRTCACIACSPASVGVEIDHAKIDQKCARKTHSPTFDPPHTRAYVHHLLHTHEMSAHTLLAAHNLAVAEEFFTSIRKALQGYSKAPPSENKTNDNDRECAIALSFSAEVERFLRIYDIGLRVFGEAKEAWISVDRARGKGRLSRGKEKQGEEDLSSHVELAAELREEWVLPKADVTE